MIVTVITVTVIVGVIVINNLWQGLNTLGNSQMYLFFRACVFNFLKEFGSSGVHLKIWSITSNKDKIVFNWYIVVREIIPTANVSDKIHKSVDTKPCFYTFKNNLSYITSEN